MRWMPLAAGTFDEPIPRGFALDTEPCALAGTMLDACCEKPFAEAYPSVEAGRAR